MPVELSDLLGNERWVEVQVAGGTFNIAYRPESTSLYRQAELNKRMRLLQAQTDADELEQTDEIGTIFCEVVSNWDLTDGGRPLPLTPQVATRGIPGPWFNAIMEAISNDRDASQEEKKVSSVRSAAGFPREARPENVQNGIPQSERHGTWA